MANARLDVLLVERGLMPTRSRARDAIRRGCVTVDGDTIVRPGAPTAVTADIVVSDPASAYVSRAALKLIGALDHFGYAPEERFVLDLGASTGGFTQVLLERGATGVAAVDVGHDQLHPSLRNDPRVARLDGRNARDLTAADLPRAPDAVVADLSFISLKLALAAPLGLAGAGAWGVFLIKPQFEVGRDGLGKGGVVRDAAAARAAADDLAAWLDGRDGWHVDGLVSSPIAGGDGNAEFLLGARKR